MFYKKLEKQLMDMIRYVEFNSKSKVLNLLPMVGYKRYCEEISTIKLSLPRQSGHTHAINQIVQKLGSDKCIIICGNHVYTEFYKQSCKNIFTQYNYNNRVRGLDNINYVFLDNCDYINFDNLYTSVCFVDLKTNIPPVYIVLS